MKTDLFQSCGHCWVFHICWDIKCSTFTASYFRIWNSSAGILSPPLALFVEMLPKAYFTSHSRVSGFRWVFTPSWLSGSLRSFLYSSSVKGKFFCEGIPLFSFLLRKHFPENLIRIFLSHWINLHHVLTLKPVIGQGNQYRMIVFINYDSLFWTGSEACLPWRHGWRWKGGYLGKEGKERFERSWLFCRLIVSPDMLCYAKIPSCFLLLSFNSSTWISCKPIKYGILIFLYIFILGA